MLTKRSIVPAVLLLAILVSACRDTPSFPTFVEALPAQTQTPPAPSTEVLGQWNVTTHLTAVSGDKCAAEAVQSLIGTPKTYSITLTQTGSRVDVTVTGTSGDCDCVFKNATADSNGFTTFGTSGTFRCKTYFRVDDFYCSDGVQANLFTWGQDVSGSISGSEISGKWAIDWFDMIRSANLETMMEFVGRRP